MVPALRLEDLAVAGLGCDVAGAALLARGLLLSPLQILYASGGQTYGGANHRNVGSRIADRVAGVFGLGSLLVGFILQAAGYLVSLGREDSGTGRSGDIAATVTAGVVGATCALLVFAAYRLFRDRLARRAVIEVARMDQWGDRHRDPFMETLFLVGKELWAPTENTMLGYVERVFAGVALNEHPSPNAVPRSTAHQAVGPADTAGTSEGGLTATASSDDVGGEQ